MGEKSKPGAIYYSLDGKEFKKLDIDSLTMVTEPEMTTLADQQSINDFMESIYKPQTVSWKITSPCVFGSKILYKIFGKSNNWLRLHGYPMIRKVG